MPAYEGMMLHIRIRELDDEDACKDKEEITSEKVDRGESKGKLAQLEVVQLSETYKSRDDNIL
ncbi:MAG: hypothetical protein M1113_01285 [Candidatus Thermoplasmatota archaeon]|nr:hypothetical protein [Candidatus Thermoplasmatota archaeon]